MEKLIASQNKLWLIFLFDLFLIVRAQMEDENAMKVFSCINIVTSKNFKTGEMEPSYYSPIVLTCFFKIKKEQVQKILSSLGEEEDPLDPDELKELTNVDGLKDYSEEEVKKKQAELDSIVREFQRIDEEYEMREKEKYMSKFESENEDENYIDSDDNYELGQDQDSDSKGFFKFLKSIIEGIIKVVSKLWFVLFILTILFLILLMVRKSYDLEKSIKMKNEDKKKEKEVQNKIDIEKEKEKEEELEKDKTKID